MVLVSLVKRLAPKPMAERRVLHEHLVEFVAAPKHVNQDRLQRLVVLDSRVLMVSIFQRVAIGGIGADQAERLATSGSAAIASTGALWRCIRATCPAGMTCNRRQRRLSRIVMGKGLKVPRTCADRHDGGPNWPHE